jgi:hypothetical protein
LSGENPDAASHIGNLDLHSDLGSQSYRGLTLSATRRAINGVMLSGNYTLSRCYGDPSLQTGGFPLIASGYTNPANPDFDRGVCDHDRTHIANLTVAVEMPEFGHARLRRWASGWKLAGIFAARSGSPVNVVTGQDYAFTGIRNQRANQILTSPYGRTPERWLNPAAFAPPAPGTLGTMQRNSLRGPAFVSLDLALSRSITFGANRSMEFRFEAFNVFNTPNWDAPANTLSSSSFGRITSLAGPPRVLQIGMKVRFRRSLDL